MSTREEQEATRLATEVHAASIELVGAQDAIRAAERRRDLTQLKFDSALRKLTAMAMKGVLPSESAEGSDG